MTNLYKIREWLMGVIFVIQVLKLKRRQRLYIYKHILFYQVKNYMINIIYGSKKTIKKILFTTENIRKIKKL